MAIELDKAIFYIGYVYLPAIFNWQKYKMYSHILIIYSDDVVHLCEG